MPVLFKPKKTEDKYVVWSSLLGAEPLSRLLTAEELIDEVERGVNELGDISVPEVKSMIDRADRSGCSELENEQWDKAQAVFDEKGEPIFIEHSEMGEFADRYFADDESEVSDLDAGSEVDTERE